MGPCPACRPNASRRPTRCARSHTVMPSCSSSMRPPSVAPRTSPAGVGRPTCRGSRARRPASSTTLAIRFSGECTSSWTTGRRSTSTGSPCTRSGRSRRLGRRRCALGDGGVDERPDVRGRSGRSGRARAGDGPVHRHRGFPTAMMDRIGDTAWRELLSTHNRVMRGELNAFRGREIATTGDGFLAVFDGATRAVRCGAAMARSADQIGLGIRVGLHTGEVEFVGPDARGVAVHAAARVMAFAGPGEVVMSSTTKDLLEWVGPGLQGRGRPSAEGIARRAPAVQARRDGGLKVSSARLASAAGRPGERLPRGETASGS